MNVRFFMTPDPAVIDSDDLVEVARDRMNDIGARHLPVVNEEGLVGVVSQRDVNNASLAVLGLPVSQIMSAPPLTVGPDDEVAEAAQIMLSHRVSGLPVVTADGTLMGVITTTNCLVALVQFHHELKRLQGASGQ